MTARSVGVFVAAAVVTAAVSAAGASATPALPPAVQAAPKPVVVPDIVVRIDVAKGYRIDDLASRYPVTVGSAVLASRGIYLLHPVIGANTDPKKVEELAKSLDHAAGVLYAEIDKEVEIGDSQFHSWPFGDPQGSVPSAWSDQPIVAALQLDLAHQISTGAGVTVAVLDTGVDPQTPALAGRLAPGWNYVDDDPDTADVASGVDSNGDGRIDSAAGHGTFVSGLISLVAPSATIVPERVLDSDGTGNVFVVAQAVLDALDAGAQVINLSAGAMSDTRSDLLDDALAEAKRRGAIVVVAAGNEGNNRPRYLASKHEVVSVAALDDSEQALAPYSNRGSWVAVAAPGDDLVGPLPGGVYATWSGTSMATPLVTGQVALIRSLAPQLDSKPTTDAIYKTVRHLDHKYVRTGIINVLSSLTEAQRHH